MTIRTLANWAKELWEAFPGTLDPCVELMVDASRNDATVILSVTRQNSTSLCVQFRIAPHELETHENLPALAQERFDTALADLREFSNDLKDHP